MNLCIITYKYPGKRSGTDYSFVKQLVDAIAQLGHHCHVVVPFNITHYHKLVEKDEKYDCGAGSVTVYRPGYMSFSEFHIGNFYLSDWTHKRALKKAFHRLEVKPDAIYGHFWKSAYNGFEFAKKNNIPLFVATGESEIRTLFRLPKDIENFSNYISGVVCVSSKNRDESITLGLTDPTKCEVFPNAVNAELFKKMNKSLCREQLGFSQSAFIVVFVGWFTERKGPKRLSEAIKLIHGENVFSIFIGKGEQEPDCDNILFKGALPHEQIPVYLNAADVFVLPTLHEGCCNAVVEAMACGLPIISSDLPFNYDVLDKKNSIMINPNKIEEISSAIQTLMENRNLKEELSKGALEKAKSLTINNRASKIVDFIKSKI